MTDLIRPFDQVFTSIVANKSSVVLVLLGFGKFEEYYSSSDEVGTTGLVFQIQSDGVRTIKSLSNNTTLFADQLSAKFESFDINNTNNHFSFQSSVFYDYGIWNVFGARYDGRNTQSNFTTSPTAMVASNSAMVLNTTNWIWSSKLIGLSQLSRNLGYDYPASRIHQSSYGSSNFNSRIYVNGGLTQDSVFLNEMWNFNPNRIEWTNISDYTVNTPSVRDFDGLNAASMFNMRAYHWANSFLTGDFHLSCFGIRPYSIVSRSCNILDMRNSNMHALTNISTVITNHLFPSSTAPTPPPARIGITNGMVKLNDTAAFLFGGGLYTNGVLNVAYDDAWVLDCSYLPARLIWKKIDPISSYYEDDEGETDIQRGTSYVPAPRSRHLTMYLAEKNSILIYGGQVLDTGSANTSQVHGDNNIYEFDLNSLSWLRPLNAMEDTTLISRLTASNNNDSNNGTGAPPQSNTASSSIFDRNRVLILVFTCVGGVALLLFLCLFIRCLRKRRKSRKEMLDYQRNMTDIYRQTGVMEKDIKSGEWGPIHYSKEGIRKQFVSSPYLVGDNQLLKSSTKTPFDTPHPGLDLSSFMSVDFVNARSSQSNRDKDDRDRLNEPFDLGFDERTGNYLSFEETSLSEGNGNKFKRAKKPKDNKKVKDESSIKTLVSNDYNEKLKKKFSKKVNSQDINDSYIVEDNLHEKTFVKRNPLTKLNMTKDLNLSPILQDNHNLSYITNNNSVSHNDFLTPVNYGHRKSTMIEPVSKFKELLNREGTKSTVYTGFSLSGSSAPHDIIIYPNEQNNVYTKNLYYRNMYNDEIRTVKNNISNQRINIFNAVDDEEDEKENIIEESTQLTDEDVYNRQGISKISINLEDSMLQNKDNRRYYRESDVYGQPVMPINVSTPYHPNTIYGNELIFQYSYDDYGLSNLSSLKTKTKLGNGTRTININTGSTADLIADSTLSNNYKNNPTRLSTTFSIDSEDSSKTIFPNNNQKHIIIPNIYKEDESLSRDQSEYEYGILSAIKLNENSIISLDRSLINGKYIEKVNKNDRLSISIINEFSDSNLINENDSLQNSKLNKSDSTAISNIFKQNRNNLERIIMKDKDAKSNNHNIMVGNDKIMYSKRQSKDCNELSESETPIEIIHIFNSYIESNNCVSSPNLDNMKKTIDDLNGLKNNLEIDENNKENRLIDQNNKKIRNRDIDINIDIEPNSKECENKEILQKSKINIDIKKYDKNNERDYLMDVDSLVKRYITNRKSNTAIVLNQDIKLSDSKLNDISKKKDDLNKDDESIATSIGISTNYLKELVQFNFEDSMDNNKATAK